MPLVGVCSAPQRVFVEEVLRASLAPWGRVTTPLSGSGTVHPGSAQETMCSSLVSFTLFFYVFELYKISPS